MRSQGGAEWSSRLFGEVAYIALPSVLLLLSAEQPDLKVTVLVGSRGDCSVLA